MSKKLRILFLEDVPSDVTLVQHELRKGGLSCQVKRVETERDFRAELNKHPDVILSDHGLPSFDGFAALSVARKRCPEIPFIFVTDSMGEETTINAFEQGATDYVLKRQLSKLVSVVKKALRENKRKVQRENNSNEGDDDFRTLVESLQDHAVLKLDAEGNIAFWNAGATELYGFKSEQMIGRNFSALYPETQEGMRHAKQALASAEGKGTFQEEAWHVTKRGKYINVQLSIRRLADSAGNVAGFVHVSHRVGEPVAILRPLATTEERYRELIEFCPCAVMVVGTTGQILYANSAAVELLGAKRTDDLLCRTLKDISPPGDGRNILERIRETHGQSAGFIEHELVRLDEKRVPVDISATPVLYLGATQLEIVAHDITKRKDVEQAHHHGKRHVKAILETAFDAVISIDHEGKIREWNPAAERIFGYKRTEAIERQVDDLIVSESFRKMHQEGLRNYLVSGGCDFKDHPVEATLHRANGEEFRAELSVTPNGPEDSPWCTAVVRDITDQKQNQAALQKSEEYFRLLVEGVKDYAIYMLDTTGHVVGWNSGAERLEGYHPDEIIGKHFSVFFTPEDVQAGVPQSILNHAEAEGESLNEGWRVRKDGSRFWTRGAVTALRDSAGKLQGFAKISHDRTQQKQNEEEILRLNATLEQRVADRTAQLEAANAELEAFSYSVSHDLRSPLRHITGYIEILRLEAAAALTESNRRHLATITESAQKMGQLVDALLAFSRIGRTAMRRENVQLGALVEQARRDLPQETLGRKIEWNIKSLPSVRGDPFLLRQVMVNLISNALKYTRNRNPARIEIGSQQGDKAIIIYVRDNGVGFDMRYVDKLFGVFQRLHRTSEFEGTGIGLANVRRVIHRHGGRTWAEGKVNGGATFYFSLPKRMKGTTT